MASHDTHMLRFASCRASSRTYMCVPESRQSRSLAYERRAVPYPVACRVPEGRSRVVVLAKAKSCLRASDCVPSRRWIACGLESKLHSDMASQEIRMLRFGPTEHPHAHKTCAPESRVKPCLRIPCCARGWRKFPVVPDVLRASRDLDKHPRTVDGVGADSRPRFAGRLKSGATPPTQPNQNTK